MYSIQASIPYSTYSTYSKDPAAIGKKNPRKKNWIFFLGRIPTLAQAWQAGGFYAGQVARPGASTPGKSLLTGAINQIESHPKKTLARAWCGPGAGLARAWCGPGAGSKTEAAEPVSLQDRSRGAGLAQTEAAEPASLCGNFRPD